jgi:hypothetical protein
VSEQTCRETKNPPDQLRQVYDILIYIHITITSPERKDENDDVMLNCGTFLIIINAKVVKN